MPTQSPSQHDQQDAQRREIAHSLTGYMQKRMGKPTSETKVYAERIRSGEHDDFMRRISIALQEQSRLILADLEGESVDAQGPDIPTLLFMHDTDHRVSSVPSRRGQRRTAKDPENVLAGLSQQAAAAREDPFVAISEPYGPCVAPLESLEVIKLSELTTETHHRGKILFVERIGIVIQSSIRTLCAIKDDDGEAEAVELYHRDASLAEDLPSETFFFIKEPYFTLSTRGFPVIRVDHPTDVVNPDSSPKGLSKLASKQQVSRTASEWKDVGNGFFAKQEYFKAGRAYQSALKAGAEGKLRLDVSRNLARVDLTLGRHEQARVNAINAVSDGSDPALVALDVKAYFRAASASYQLRDFPQSEEYSMKLLALASHDEDGLRLLERVRARLREIKDGEHDFQQLVKRLSRQQPRVDIADFTKRTVAGTSKGRGRGLFAAEDVSLGGVILCEKALCATFEWESENSSTKTYDVRLKKFDGFPAALWMSTVQKLQQTSPQCITQVTSLTGRHQGLASKAVVADGSHIIDAFQIHDIIAANAFAIPTPAKTQKTEAFGVMKTIVPAGTDSAKAMNIPDNCALFSYASLVNHSCLPNATRVFIGDAIVLRATRAIRKGEEILHSYVMPTVDVAVRHTRMELIWGFRCDCTLCKVEGRESDDIRQRRAAVVEEAGKLADDLTTHLVEASQRSEVVRRGERLHARLKATFKSEIYDGLPRAGMSHIQAALAQIYCFRKEYTRCRTMIIEAFDCLGWTLILHKAGATAAELMSPKPGHETRFCEEMSKKDRKLAEQVRELARTVYVALNGVEYGIGKIDADLGASGTSTGIPTR
ncbi:hypothetical protein B0A55_10430 [Friedmanniomyces simplex]|uniref:SET domain-containing protein n=1 Tax=Friedmanniomyces simplex TaxID=329884 RepID=A0A4U0WIZ8_9PEZI|nr:hypothetical protein B0A55_10430 [Friedmanniomyces simplex]